MPPVLESQSAYPMQGLKKLLAKAVLNLTRIGDR